jgi:hypothetical protein
MAASSSVILKDFDIVGPTITVASLGSSQLVTVTAPYIAPSVTGTDVSKLTSRVFAAELAFVDLSTNTFEAGVFVNPNANAKTSFDVFLDPGTYVPYSEVLPPSNTGFVAAASFIQVLLRQAGPNVTVAAHGPPVATSYTVAPFTASILGGFAIGGLDDPSGVYGEDNAIPFTYVIDCPASETFSLECANAIYLSPSELLGGRFTLYGLTGASRLAFTYTTLDGTVIIGPTVTAPASSTPQAVTLTAPYSNPKMWGSITLTGDTNGQLLAMWTQACPASEPFSIGCANGVSDTVASFGLLFFGGSSVSLGYGMDLPHGAWKIAAVGTTDPNFASTQQLGPAKSIIVGGVYPVLNLSASV